MNEKVLAAGVLLLFLAAGGICAEEQAVPLPEPSVDLTMEKAVELALAENAGIRRQHTMLAAAKRKADFSWNSVSPAVSLSAGVTGPGSDTGTDSPVYAEGKVNLSLAPDAAGTVQTARREYEVQKLLYDAAVRTVEENVRSAYLTLVYEQENILLQTRNLDMAQKQFEQSMLRYRAGTVSELDMLSSRVNYEKLKPQVQEASVTYANDLALLLQSAGLGQDTAVHLSGTLGMYADRYDAFMSEKNSAKIQAVISDDTAPSIVLAAKRLEAARAALVKVRLAAYGPSVSAGCTLNPARLRNNAAGAPGGAGTFSLGVSIPLDSWFPWSAGAETVSAARDTAADLELSLSEERNTVRISAANCLRRIAQKKESISIKNAGIQFAEQSYRAARDAYGKGVKDFLALQNASNALLEAEVSLESDLLEYVKACIALEDLLGVPYGTLSE